MDAAILMRRTEPNRLGSAQKSLFLASMSGERLCTHYISEMRLPVIKQHDIWTQHKNEGREHRELMIVPSSEGVTGWWWFTGGVTGGGKSFQGLLPGGLFSW